MPVTAICEIIALLCMFGSVVAVAMIATVAYENYDDRHHAFPLGWEIIHIPATLLGFAVAVALLFHPALNLALMIAGAAVLRARSARLAP